MYIQEIKKLENDFNNKIKELKDKYPKIEIRTASITHPKFKGEKGLGLITIWGYDKITEEEF